MSDSAAAALLEGEATTPAPAHLLVRQLTKSFGSNPVLRGIDLEIGRGEVAVIIGGSGAGKTTLLKVLIGLVPATSGSILIGGQDVVSARPRLKRQLQKKFGMVFQYSALLDSMTVGDNVGFPLVEHTKLSRKEIAERVTEKLALLDLHGVERLYPSELSGGMRKRVGLARALMLDPEVLMYDEPTSGLDPLSSRLVDELIVDTRDRFGVTSLIISHDMAGALKIADRIFLLHRGQLAVQGTPRELTRMTGTLANDFFTASGIDAERVVASRKR